MKPQNFPEKVVWYLLIGIYGLYFAGAQFIIVPAAAWFLTFYIGFKIWTQTEKTPDEEKIIIPIGVWVWILGMLVLEVALIQGHSDFDMGWGKIINSTIFQWLRQTAMMALFPLVGCLNIRPQLIYRAICIVCLQSLIFMPICFLASVVHIPEYLYYSPLRIIGRGGETFYAVSLYNIDSDTHAVRLQLFTPWAPALALVANVYFFLACQESNRKWRWIGIIGSIAMCVVTQSRLGVICFPIILLLSAFLSNVTKPLTNFLGGILCFLGGIFSSWILDGIKTFKAAFNGARASSSEVRSNLKEIAIYRWKTEAPIWGHGELESGPKVVEHMPIGSHHTWAGLLFMRGIVGFMAFAIPMLWSFVELLIKAQKSNTAKAGLNVVLVLFLFTFAENIDTLSYLFWPGLVIMGLGFKEAVIIKDLLGDPEAVRASEANLSQVLED
jgi:hypothetical protein